MSSPCVPRSGRPASVPPSLALAGTRLLAHDRSTGEAAKLPLREHLGLLYASEPSNEKRGSLTVFGLCICLTPPARANAKAVRSYRAGARRVLVTTNRPGVVSWTGKAHERIEG